jgi:hypothetical protein
VFGFVLSLCRTNARVVGVVSGSSSKSIPVRTVFLAHGDEEQCFANGKIQEHPCSTHDGSAVYADADACKQFNQGVTKTFSVSSKAQTAEQDAVSGGMYLTSSDLEFCNDMHGHQVGGVRDTGDQVNLHAQQ